MQRESQDGTKRSKNLSSCFRIMLMVPLVLLVMFSLVQGEEEAMTGKEYTNDGASTLRDTWGIEIVRLRLTAAGHIVDLRYRVIDPVKSFPIFDAKIKPVLMDEQSGRDLSIYTAPRIGGMRQKTRKPEAGRVYFILFSNPGGLMKSGSKVTLKIENLKVEHIRIEDESIQAPSKAEVNP